MSEHAASTRKEQRWDLNPKPCGETVVPTEMLGFLYHSYMKFVDYITPVVNAKLMLPLAGQFPLLFGLLAFCTSGWKCSGFVYSVKCIFCLL